MPGTTSTPDSFFTSEFGTTELSKRLWRGGLRATADGYSISSSPRSLISELSSSIDMNQSDTAAILLEALETTWNEPARMRRACVPMPHQGPTSMPVSLVRLVLGIESFQAPMVTVLVNKISEYGNDDAENSDMAILLLNQLRWLDFLVDGNALCESLLAIVPIVTPSMQKSIVEALPEIVDDACRNAAVEELVRLMADSPDMMGSVVDALAALGVEQHRCVEVNSSVLSTMAAANGDMLPVCLRYVLRTCPPELLSRTVRTLRSTLALPGLGAAAGRLCVDAVRAGLRMTKNVADEAVKVLKGLDKIVDFKPADIWIIIALLDSPLHRKSAEILFRKKAGKNLFTRALFDAAFAPFVSAFEGLTGRILEMGSIAIRGNELGARQTGVVLYAIIFRLFAAGNTRRNVITALLDHVGTRKEAETDAALEALVLIAKEAERDRAMLPHSSSVQGLLDFLEFFSDSQLRQIWTVLAYLCRSSAAKLRREGRERRKNAKKDEKPHEQQLQVEGESELAMLEILLRKELTHADPFYRRIGVLGACTMIKVLGKKVKNNVLQMLLENGKNYPRSRALAYDELAQVFGKGDPESRDIAESIRKTISDVFENSYIAEHSEVSTMMSIEDVLPAELYGNLEGGQNDVCFSISRVIRNEDSLQCSQDAVRSMVPNLRLLCILTLGGFDGSLSEIDAIIGAPLHIPLLPHGTDISSLSTRAKGDLLLSLFVAHGWMVELLNGFGAQDSGEFRGKCLKRIDQLLELSSQISTCVSSISLWKEVVFDSYNGSRASPQNQVNKQANKKRKGVRGSKDSQNGYGNTREWQSFARQLDPSALALLRITTPVTWRFTETEMDPANGANPTTETVSLSSKGLHFLLNELAAHIDILVQTELKGSNSLSTVLFRPSASKLEYRMSSLESGADGKLKCFRSLRNAITALGPQLSHCMKCLIPSNLEECGLEDTSLEINRNCVALCLRGLSLTLQSKIMSDSSAEDLIFTILASIRLDGKEPMQSSDPLTSADIEVAAKQAFKQLRYTLNEILSNALDDADPNNSTSSGNQVGFHCCSAFLATIDSVFSFVPETDRNLMGPKLSKVAYALLEHPWDDTTLRNKKTQKLIPGIVRLYVQNATDSFSTLTQLREEVVKFTDKLVERNANVETQHAHTAMPNNATGLGSLTEQTSNAFSVAVLEQYIWLFKRFQPKTFSDPEDALTQMKNFIAAENPLYMLARKSQRLLGPVMRAGKTLVDAFLKSWVPYLKEHYKEHRPSVVAVCKMHQKPTRLLQTFCAHSKYTRDTSLTGLVPPLRKSLELLLYRVKDMLQAHNADEAFTLGNLKHRDINGEVLGSQHLQYKSDSNEDESSSDDGESDTGEDDIPIARVRDATAKKTRKITKGGVAKGQKQTQNSNEQKRKGKQRRSQKPKPEPSLSAPLLSLAELDADEPDSEDKVSSIVPPRIRSREKAGKTSRKQRRRKNPLIDDEADCSDGEDNELEEHDVDLSQWLDFGDQHEE